jgi:hypothetical protein
MPTIASLVASEAIVPLDIPVDTGEPPWRWLYGTKDFVRWLGQQQSDDAPSPLGIEEGLVEQLDNLFSIFVEGVALHHDRDFHVIDPSERGVWELKTVDLRIFGWFLQRNHFLCVHGMMTDVAKATGMHAGHAPMYSHARGSVERLMKTLSCEQQLCVYGTEPYDVISVRYRP